MESFKSQLRHKIHGRRMVPTKMLTVQVEEAATAIPYDEQTEHTLIATIGTRFVCRDEELPHMKEEAYKHILRYVYGDIVEDIYQLMDIIYKTGDRKGIEIIRKVMKKIT